jgi:hypothetical protein
MGTEKYFPEGKAAGGLKLTTHLNLLSKLRMVELYLHSPTSLDSVVLNDLSLGITLHITFTIDRKYPVREGNKCKSKG